MQTTTRFAPSPTGSLHLGGVRTALYSWLHARHNQGTFILRIEDTDKERSTPESTQQILNSLDWLAIDYDAIYYQSQRNPIYQQRIEQLLAEDKAYYCHCSPDRLDQLREQQMAAQHKPRYDGHCRDKNLSSAAGAVIRLRTPQKGTIAFHDQIRGAIEIDNQELDDLILVRSDASPTYNFCCVIDDAEMNITLVMRGDDHINNTPRQIHIYNALGYPIPDFAHLPMILGSDGKRLSKRHGALGVLDYQQAGYLSDGLLNYLARLGWSYGDQELFSRTELTDKFTLNTISKSPASYSTDKLLWTNKQHLKNMPVEQVHVLLEPFLAPTSLSPQTVQLLPLYIERSDTILQLAQSLAPYTKDVVEFEQQAAKKHLRPVALEPLQSVKKSLEQLTDWQAETLHNCIHQTAEQLGLGMGKVGMPLRVAITGTSFSPSLDQVLACIAKEQVLARIDTAIRFIEQKTIQPFNE